MIAAAPLGKLGVMITLSPRLGKWLVLLVFVALPTAVFANMPIFFVFAGVRITLWWTVLLAVAIEALALRYVFALTWRRALWAAFLINVGTALLGFFVYPFVGMLSFPVLAPIVTEAFGTGQAVEIAAYCLAAAIIDTPIELALLALISATAGYRLKIGPKAVAVFFIANLVSASVLFAAIQEGPRKRPVDAETRQLIEDRFAEETAFARTVFRDLPNHIDETGDVDPIRRAELVQQAKILQFFELMVGTRQSQYAIVSLELSTPGVGFSYSYEKERYDGEAKVTRGTLQKFSTRDPGVDETLDVLHYHLFSEDRGAAYSVRAILLLSSGH